MPSRKGTSCSVSSVAAGGSQFAPLPVDEEEVDEEDDIVVIVDVVPSCVAVDALVGLVDDEVVGAPPDPVSSLQPASTMNAENEAIEKQVKRTSMRLIMVRRQQFAKGSSSIA